MLDFFDFCGNFIGHFVWVFDSELIWAFLWEFQWESLWEFPCAFLWECLWGMSVGFVVGLSRLFVSIRRVFAMSCRLMMIMQACWLLCLKMQVIATEAYDVSFLEGSRQNSQSAFYVC